MIEVLEATVREKINEKTSKVYWDILKGYSNEEIKKATIECVRKCKFFPKIAEIIEMIEGSPEEEAELAYLYFKEKLEKEGSYISVQSPRYPAVASVVEALGGWDRVGETNIENEVWLKRDFIKMYPIMKKRGNHPKQLPGIFEIENSRKGYTEETMPARYRLTIGGKRIRRKELEAKK